MKNLLSIMICLAIAFQATAQNFTITGSVVDAETKEPLIGASVFAQNTTTGTVTNKDGRFSIDLRAGGYDLVISYTGYITQLVRVSNAENAPLNIELKKEDLSMSEVVIKSSNEVENGWEKYGQFFLDHFIGATPFAKQCTLENPQSLKFLFYKKSNKLKVLATEPVRIHNAALGYNLTYLLDSFMYYYPTSISSYRGYCFFAEDSTGTVSQRRVWRINRQKAYEGSKLHFLRAYYDSTLKQDGFVIRMLNENSNDKFSIVQNPYDSLHYFVSDSSSEVEIYYPRKISVSFSSIPETEYLKQYGLPLDIGIQSSYVDLLNAIAIKENGYYYDQKDWINQGYWSWKNLGDMLPYDYNR